MIKTILKIKISKFIALVVLLQLCAVANFSIFHLFNFATLHAQGIPYIHNYPATEYMAHKMNFDIITDEDGTVYAANFEGLLYYDYSQWRIIYTPGITRITTVFRDSKNVVWTGGYNYIGYIETDSQGRLQLHSIDRKQLFNGEVLWIWEKEGHIYFKVSDNKTYAIHNDNVVWAAGAQVPTSGFSVFGTETHVSQVQELGEGLKAVATNGDGIIFIDEEGKELFRVTEENGLCSNNVNHITYNRHGLIWGATDNGLFTIAFPSIYTRFTSYEGLRGEVVAIDKLGKQLYAGTQSGLFRLEGKRFIPVANITHACWQLSRQGESLLAATSDGVYRITGSTATTQLTTANTFSLLVDGDAFYSGEAEGVYFNINGTRKQVSDIEKVTHILRDQQGNIWIQNLYGKIWKSPDGHVFEPYSESDNKDEMATLVPYKGVTPVLTDAIEPFPFSAFSYLDNEGVTWLTDHKGKHLYAFQEGSRQEALSAEVYPLMDNSVRAMLRDNQLLWIGGDKGINVVDGNHHDPVREQKKPKLMLRCVMLGNDSVLWGGYGRRPEVLPEISSDERHIRIYYTITAPSLLLKTQYRHRINNGNWTSWETDTYEEYPNLPSGSYTFEVQARDAFGQVSDIVGISFTIKSPFYLRWYMVVLYLLLAAAAVYGLLQLRLRKLERDKHELERIVKERSKEVVRLEKMATTGKLTQGLIDRILNPLNYINNFAKLSEGLVEDVKANVEDEKEHIAPDNYDDTMDVLDMLKGNLRKVGEHGASTSRTLKAMEEILKYHSGGMTEMSLTAMLQQDEDMTRKRFEKEITQHHILTTFSKPDLDIRIKGNAEQLNKTMMSLLANAVYAVAKQATRQEHYTPKVSLVLSVEGQTAHIKVRDNGIGIEQNIIQKIFDPFFTTKTTAEASGVGLYLSREIIQSHGGDISVESQKNVFTEFTITLPTL